MKLDEYKKTMNKLDTDKAMDQRIKNKLIYSDYAEGQLDDKNAGGKHRSFFRHFQKMSILRPVFSTLAFLAFAAVLIYGVIRNQPDQKVNPASETGNSPAVSELTEDADVTQTSGTDSTADGNGIIDESTPDASFNADAPAVTELPINMGNDLITNAQTPEITLTPGEETVLPSDSTEVTGDTAGADASMTGSFYFASFDVLTKNNVKASIPNLIIRLHGNVDTINPEDLTDIELTRDGVPIDNKISLVDRVDHFVWNYEDISDFYFKFDIENTEPGNYGLTGKYKGVPFTVYNKILEASVTDEAADPADLRSVCWGYMPNKDDSPISISELVFCFDGIQNAFYPSDLTDLKLTNNGEEISFAFTQQVFRYLEANYAGGGDTSFNLILKDQMSDSGTYVISGCYKGVPFTSGEITIP